MAKEMGAFLGLLKSGGKKPKPKGLPLNDEVDAGKAYSKTGEAPGDGEDDTEPDEDMDDTGGAKEAAFQSFASALGIAPEKRAQAQAALETFVKSCPMMSDE